MSPSPQKTANPSAKISTSTWYILLFIVSLATMAVHAYLTLQHYQLKLGLAEGKSLCNVSSTFNCDSVAISSYATLFGIPMALLGLISQVVFFVLLLAARLELSSSTESLRRFLFWISTFVFGTSVVMALISAFGLGTYCLFCMTAYALSILQLTGAWKIQLESPLARIREDLGALLSQARWALILFLLIPVFGWLAHSILLDSYGFGRLQIAIDESVATWESSPTLEFQTERGLSQQKGSGPTKMTIVEFADFLCPHCKAASPSLEAFAQSHPDVRLIFKTFPLDGKCNKAVTRQGDGLRCRLSAAMICAENLNQKGWEAHHWIFERQEHLYTTAGFESVSNEISKDLGLDKASFESCLNADGTHDSILAMAQEGASISGTPTVFVNGKLLPRGQILPVLEAVYKKLK